MIIRDDVVYQLVEEEAERLGFRLMLYATHGPECAGGALKMHVVREDVCSPIPLWRCCRRASIRRWLKSLTSPEPRNSRLRRSRRRRSSRVIGPVTQLSWLDLL